jgi:hypothetical protein
MRNLTLANGKKGLLALVAIAGLACHSPVYADENDAKNLLKAMSDYLAAQKSISFDFDTSLEVVTADQQRLALASSGSVNLSRPDKIRATRTGGFADVEMLFDGKTVTLLGKNLNLYTRAQVSGTVDNLVDQLRDKFNRPLPAADLLMSNPYDELMQSVTEIRDVGSGIIRGQECDHLAIRTEEVDWQIWIAQGPSPFPCRYIVSSKKVGGGPQYTLDIRNWQAGVDAGIGDFSFKAPEGAKEVKPEELRDIDELPDMFRPKT